jgi:hypothetical protein
MFVELCYHLPGPPISHREGRLSWSFKTFRCRDCAVLALKLYRGALQSPHPGSTGLATRMGLKNTTIIGLLILVPIAILVLVIAVSIKCASCGAATWAKLASWIRNQMRRYPEKERSEFSEESKSSGSSITEASRAV